MKKKIDYFELCILIIAIVFMIRGALDAFHQNMMCISWTGLAISELILLCYKKLTEKTNKE